MNFNHKALLVLSVGVFALLFIIGFVIGFETMNPREQEGKVREVGTINDHYVRVWIDPETKCQYLLNVRGGIQIRRAANGTHMCERNAANEH